MTAPTPQQIERLHQLEAAYDATVADEQAKTAAAAARESEAQAAQKAAAEAKAEADAAALAETEALKALRDYVQSLFDPVVGVDVQVGPSTVRP